MVDFLQYTVNGLVSSSFYPLLALGLAVIFGMLTNGWRSLTQGENGLHGVPWELLGGGPVRLVLFLLGRTDYRRMWTVRGLAHRKLTVRRGCWWRSGNAVIVVVLGGIGTLRGGVVGAALLVRLEDWLSFSGVQQIGLVTGVIAAGVLLFRRGLFAH